MVRPLVLAAQLPAGSRNARTHRTPPRQSKMRPHIARKHAGRAKCARTLPRNAPGKQSAPAHCPKTRRGSKVRPHIGRKCAGKAKCICTLPGNAPGKQSAPAHCPETRRESKVRPHIARKCVGEAKCVRTLPENAPGKQSARARNAGMREYRMSAAGREYASCMCLQTLQMNRGGYECVAVFTGVH